MTSNLPTQDKRRGLFGDSLQLKTAPKPVIAGDENVGIIGAGMAGLYTAMILESLGIPWEIIEASNRIGGRVKTHHFQNQPGEFQYFDVGAMRFPQIPVMDRLFDLFDRVGLTDELIPYYFDSRSNNSFLLYNKIRFRTNDENFVPDPDPFDFQALGVDKVYLDAGAGNIFGDVLKPYIDGLIEDAKNGGDAGWKAMMAADTHSTRSYMGNAYTPSATVPIPAKPLPTPVIDWLETVGVSTGAANRAFTELVLGSINFGAGANPDWYCIPGGSSVLASKCNDSISRGKRHFNTRVSAISYNRRTINVKGENGFDRNYSHVVSTVPLKCLRLMDLSGLPISTYQAAAIRQLEYGPAVKVGIQFDSAWWTTDLDIVGGQSFTDVPIRRVVYPSYGLQIDPKIGGKAVLIASYCWTDDSDFWNALIKGFNPQDPANDRLTTLVLRDLATVHNKNLEDLRKKVLDVFPWDWSASSDSMGADAFFGPGQFSTLYSTLTHPDKSGRFHFAGEAISIRHAWIVGALDSAWRAVDEILVMSQKWRHLRWEFWLKWGFNPDWVIPDIVDGVDPTKEYSLASDLHLSHIFANTPDLFEVEVAAPVQESRSVHA